ncbi:discoidin domain-containing protein [Helcococcus sueciensis]
MYHKRIRVMSLILAVMMILPFFSGLSIVRAEGDETSDVFVGKEGENIALSKTVTGSNHEDGTDFTKENLVDGSTTTRYSSNQNDKPITLVIDLDKISQIDTIIIDWERDADKSNILGYTLQVSDDNNEYKVVYEQTEKVTQKRQIIDIDKVNGRYLKLDITDFDGGALNWVNVGINEIEVYSVDFSGEVISSLDQITSLELNEDKTSVVLPKTVEGSKLEIVGENMPQLVNKDGEVFQPLTDKTGYVTLRLTKGESYTQKEVTVALEGKYEDEGENASPVVIPEIQEWHGGSGTLALDGVSLSGDFANVQSQFNKELGLTGVSTSGNIPIKFVKVDDKGYDKEGYYINIEESGITIEASEETGAFYATRTLLQAGKELPVGEMRDYPRFALRGFMLDTGRRFVPLHVVKDVMKTMAYYKLNDFQLHLNDNYIWLQDHGRDIDYVMNTAETGFRLESDMVGENGVKLTSDDHYTVQEFQEIKDLAEELNMNLVPEFDTPGHALSFVKVRPDLMYKGSVGSHNNVERVAMLDLDNEETLPFIKEVYEEMIAKHFGGLNTVHIGSDEYYGAVESYRRYVDNMLKYIRDDKELTPRLWGSLTSKNGSTPVTSEGVQMNIWSRGWNTEQQALKEGYDIINILDIPTYIVPNGSGSVGGYGDYASNKNIYTNWAPNNFRGNNGSIVDQSNPQLLGGAYALWNDYVDLRDTGITSSDAFVRFFASLPYIAERSWQSDRNELSYTEFKEKVDSHKVLPPDANPYYETEIEKLGLNDLSQNGNPVKGKSVKLTKDQVLESGLDQLGYNAVLEFDITLDNEENNQVLSSWGKNNIFARDEEGKLAYTFERYHIQFDYEIKANEKTNIRFVTTQQNTKVYVNDEEVEMIVNPKRPKIAHTTFILPLENIGGFDGTLHNFSLNKGEYTDPNKVEVKSYTANSEETANATANEGPIELAFDNDPRTFWHSDWNGGSYPFIVNIELDEVTPLDRLVYLPRQNGTNGIVTEYEISVSTDGEEYEIVAAGNWDNNAKAKTAKLNGVEAKYVQFEVLNSVSDGRNKFASAAEIDLFRVPVEEEVNKEDLRQTLEIMKELVKDVKDLLTEDSVKALEDQFVASQKVLDDEDVKQEDVDNVLEELNKAYQALEAKKPEETAEVNTKTLEKLIENTEAKLEELGEEITANSKSNLELALVDAKEVLKETPLTQEKVDEAVEKLLEALTSIKFKEEETPTIDKSALSQLIEKANAKLEKDLEDESKENLENAITKAKEIIAKEDLTQEEVNEAFAELVDALLNAKVKESEQPEEPKLHEAKGYITGTTNVRVSPNGQVIGTLAPGAVVEGEYEEGSDWVKFNYYGQEVYVYKPLLSNTIEVKGFASGDSNIRKSPNGEVTGLAKREEVVKGVVSIDNPNWIKTDKGYIYRPLVVDTIKVRGLMSGTTNVRMTPNGTLIGTLGKAEYVEGTLNITNPNWVRIRYQNRDGYVYRSLIVDTVSASGTVTATVNVRQTPNGKVLGTLRKGVKLTGKLSASNPNWVEIQYKVQRAYVYKEFVK